MIGEPELERPAPVGADGLQNHRAGFGDVRQEPVERLPPFGADQRLVVDPFEGDEFHDGGIGFEGSLDVVVDRRHPKVRDRPPPSGTVQSSSMTRSGCSRIARPKTKSAAETETFATMVMIRWLVFTYRL